MRQLKHREVKQLAEDLQLGNSGAPEHEHLTTVPYHISAIRCKKMRVLLTGMERDEVSKSQGESKII